MRVLLAALLLGGCSGSFIHRHDPVPGCGIVEAPQTWAHAVHRECVSLAAEFRVFFNVRVAPASAFEADRDAHVWGDPAALPAVIMGTVVASKHGPAVILNEVAFERGTWRTLLCHEVQHVRGIPHERGEYATCRGRDENKE